MFNPTTAMPYFEFLWTDEIAAHLAEHGVDRPDFEGVVSNPSKVAVSRLSGRPCCWGQTADGRRLTEPSDPWSGKMATTKPVSSDLLEQLRRDRERIAVELPELVQRGHRLDEAAARTR
jgi:hypothetical protein